MHHSSKLGLCDSRLRTIVLTNNNSATQRWLVQVYVFNKMFRWTARKFQQMCSYALA